MNVISEHHTFRITTLCFSQTATTIRTPKGSVVPDTYLLPELSQAQIAQGNSYVATAYPNATRLTDASQTYNCHGYTWHISEGGSNVWIGYNTTTAEDIYWNDGSYIETCPSFPGKVSYASDNHSAITTGTINIFKSKWGAFPLMQHDRDYMPYNSSSLKYYVKAPAISGSDQLCTSNTYSVSGLPAGATVAWSVSGPIAISGPTTGNTVTIVQNGNGSGTLTASITSTCGSAVVINKTIDAGIPMPSYISILQQSCLGGSDWEVTFQAVPAITNGQYIWVYNGVDMPATTSSSFYTYASLATSVNINLKIKNACGTSANLYSSDATFYSPCNGSRFAAYLNPAGNSMTITTSSANSSSADATKSSSTNSTSAASNTKRSFSYKIYNKTGKVLKQGSSSGKDVIVDTQDLASDNYFLHVLIGKQEIQKQIIIKH